MNTTIDPRDLVGKVVTHPNYRGVYLHVDELAFADVEVLVDEYVDDDGNCWPTYDTDEQPTGDIVCHMIGDNRRITLSPDDCTVVDDEDAICWSCGQDFSDEGLYEAIVCDRCNRLYDSASLDFEWT